MTNPKIIQLENQVELLKLALNESIKFYSVNSFNRLNNKGWTDEQCQDIEKWLSVFCLIRSIEIRTSEQKCRRVLSSCLQSDNPENELHSLLNPEFPESAWVSFFHRDPWLLTNIPWLSTK
jgi:hypothetical protein